MSRISLFSAVSIIALLSTGAAHANDEGWYLRGNAGYGVHTEANITGDMTSQVHDDSINSRGDLAASLGFGYDFDNNWRLELDGDSLWTDMGSISQIPSSSAKLRTNTLMLNAIYDFNDFDRFTPYIGAGLGLVQGDASLVAHDFLQGPTILERSPICPGTRTPTQAESCDIQDKDTGFGWQLLAGLGYALTDNLTWDTHYTYMDGPDLELEGLRTNDITGAAAPIAASFNDIGAHTLMTGLRYRFGQSQPSVKAPAPAPAPIPTFACWDGDMVFNASQCRPEPVQTVETMSCWDGSVVNVGTACPVQPAPEPVQTYGCWDGTVVYDVAQCPAEPAPVVQQTNLNLCGESSVAIFNVPTNATPKQMARLGTMPEFGDSHGLTPSQFYDKLNARYNANAVDKAYLNYLFKSMGYANGWSDAQAYMFSEEVLPVGTRGLLGLGEQHHYAYSILPSNDRDRQAFRIQSANGVVVHFMKTCGNYMYACE